MCQSLPEAGLAGMLGENLRAALGALPGGGFLLRCVDGFTRLLQLLYIWSAPRIAPSAEGETRDGSGRAFWTPPKTLRNGE